jgi:hypothetical protein
MIDNTIASGLPSFSTPGFNKTRISDPASTSVSATLPRAAPNHYQREIVEISSESSSSPSSSVKRTSSDTDVDAAPIQPLKRLKVQATGKENINIATLSSLPQKMNSTPVASKSSRPLAQDEPWLAFEKDPEPNPWRRLDRDFPSFKPSQTRVPEEKHIIPQPDLPEQHKDLLTVREQSGHYLYTHKPFRNQTPLLITSFLTTSQS